MNIASGNRSYRRSWGGDEIAADYGSKAKSRRHRRHEEKAQLRNAYRKGEL